jgi:hypothetical protein
MVRVSRPRAAASRLKAPAFRLEVAAPLPMVQGSPLKVEVSLPMGPMVRASRLMAPVLTVLAQALASQPMAPVRALPGQASQQMAPVLTVLAQALAGQASQQMAPVRALPGQASQQMAPVLTVLAQARASQPMVPVRALPGQASRQMVPVRALPGQASRQMVPEPVPPEQELPPASSQAHHRARQAMAAGCRSSSAGRR